MLHVCWVNKWFSIPDSFKVTSASGSIVHDRTLLYIRWVTYILDVRISKNCLFIKKKKIYKLHVTMVVTYNVPYSPYKAASAVIFTEIKKERTVGEHDAARIPDKLTIVWKHQW
jgi:hypothetical protein